MKRTLSALFSLALLAIQPAGADYDPIAELRARADKLREDQAKAKEALAAVEGKARDLLNQRNEVATQLEKLKREQIRVRGFQLWNAFVGSMGASFDVMQKVNPGANAFVAAAGFVTDRVYSAMNTSGDIPARLNRLDDKVKSLSPKLRMLQKAYSMTPQEVADQLVARGMIENTWLQGWKDTPEKIAESKSVVTGKGTFILEAMGPAISELESILGDMDGIMDSLMRQTPGLRLETKRLPTELHDVERQIQLQEQLKRSVIPPLPEPATVDMNAAKEYSAAAQEVVQSLRDLSANQIGCQENWRRMSAAQNGAYRTYNQRVSAAYNSVARSCGSNWSEACSAAWQAFYNYASAESKAVRDALKSAQDTNRAFIDSERDGPVSSFNSAMQSLLDSTLFIRGEEKKLRELYLSGSGLAYQAWGDFLWGNISIPIWPPVGTLQGGKKRYENWLNALEEAMDQLNESERRAQDASATAASLSAQTPNLASQLMNKRALWNCYSWELRYANGMTSPENDLRWLNGFDAEFQLTAESGKQKAADYRDMLQEALSKARIAAGVMAGEEEALRLVHASIEARRTALQAYGTGQMDVSGTQVRNYLEAFKISTEGIKTLERMIQEFGDAKKLEAYARTLIWGEPTYNPKALYVVDRKFVEQLRKSVGQMAASIQNAREAYQNARQRAEDADRAFSGRVSSMRSAMESVLPEQAILLDADALFKEVLDRLWWDSIWSGGPRYDRNLASGLLPDPAEFGDPTFGLLPLMEKFSDVSDKFLALVNPMVEYVKNAVREAKEIEKIAERVKGNTGWTTLSREAFAARVAEVRKEVMEIYEPLSKKNKAWSGSPVDLAMRNFNFAIGSLAGANSVYNTALEQANRLDEISSRITRFLSGGGDIEAGEALSREARSETASNSMASAYAAQNGNVKAALGRLDSQAQTLANWLLKAHAELAMKQTGAVQKFYEEFAQTYSSKNLGRLTRMMASDWRTDGADLADLEDTLDNSFRVFDRIQFRIQGLSIQPAGPDRFEASYTATITGQINQLGLKHEETANVRDTLVNTPEGLKIQSTHGGRLWLQ